MQAIQEASAKVDANNTANQRRVIRGRNGGTLTPFAKGQSGNPRGRGNTAATINDYRAALTADIEEGRLTAAEVEEIARSDKNGLRRAAAGWLARCWTDGFFNATPLAANDLDRILDRDIGKPTQTVRVQAESRAPHEIDSELRALLEDFPELAGAAREIVADLQAEECAPRALPESEDAQHYCI